MKLNEYSKLLAEEKALSNKMKALIISSIEEHSGKITFIPEDEDDEYPVSATLYGKHDCPVIDISEVYLGKNDEIYAAGIDRQTGIFEKDFLIYTEQFSGVLHFIAAVLGWNTSTTEVEEEPETEDLELTVLFGSDVIAEYSNTGELPSEEWLLENGGVIDTKTFRSKEHRDAWLEGLNAADGWLETLVLDPFMIELIRQKRESGF
jgi:hypothetical protein